MPARVRTGARLHFGFLNLSLAHEQLYGSLGVALESPETVVAAERAEAVSCSHSDARAFAARAVDWLDVPGATVHVEAALPRHVGLGSGTQLALAVYAAIARVYDRTPRPREAAPALDRGGRSGIGVAAFESGGFIQDAGHPVERFTTDRPPRGEWTVPPVVARHPVPPSWRFVLVRPEMDAGRSDAEEERSMRTVVEAAAGEVADEISAVVTRQLLPAIANEDRAGMGAAVEEIGRLNGVWYADEQGGVYRPPVGAIVSTLGAHACIDGAGQSSWGPTVYGVTSTEQAAAAREAGRTALSEAGVKGSVELAGPRNTGAAIDSVPAIHPGE